jgi:muramoyltetrapeptide carboxypeptidase
MRTPPYLIKGDLIALAAPARRIDESIVDQAVRFINSEGFEVKVDQEVFSTQNQFAGNDSGRRNHFQALLDNPQVKAIMCLRGGYGSVRIIDLLDFNSFTKAPKWIAGFSDITVFHMHLLSHFQVESLHCTMPVVFNQVSELSLHTLFNTLEGRPLQYSINSHPLNRRGKTQGVLFGGNLSILYNLLSSNSFPDPTGMILFIEDVDEYLYHIDRMMVALKRAGVLSKLAGLVVGGFTEMRDNQTAFGKTAEDIVYEHVNDYHFPVCFGFPAGHINENLALVMGREMLLDVEKTTVRFTQLNHS